MYGSILNNFQSGGLIVYLLAGISVVGLAIAFERMMNLRSERIVSNDLLLKAERLWKAGDFNELHILVDGHKCVMSRVVKVILKHRRKSFDNVSMIASDSANSAIKKELHLIYPLNIIATISPLLGLLGTIIGMIDAFRMIVLTGVSGDATIVADGISRALVTTAAGLIVGIPALAFYHYFKGRIGRFSGIVEESTNTILYEWLLEDK